MKVKSYYVMLSLLEIVAGVNILQEDRPTEWG